MLLMKVTVNIFISTLKTKLINAHELEFMSHITTTIIKSRTTIAQAPST